MGRPGWSLAQRYIFDEECAAAGAPPIEPNGIKMVGPVIYTFGSEAQKRRYLPRILCMEDWWCQGFSEPDAGSDLANLRTAAKRDGDHLVVNGQKAWTTQAHFATMIYCLVRTRQGTARKQEGISFLLVDMATPGISVRPVITLDGAHNVNEVFFDDVRVPADNVVGEVDKGWTYAKHLLNLERTSIAHVARSKNWLRQLKGVAAERRAGGSLLIDDPVFRHRLARFEIDLLALELTNQRVLARQMAGGEPGPEASVLKIRGSELAQDIMDLTCKALGPYAVPFVRHGEPALPDAVPGYAADKNSRFLYVLAASIYGGANEVLKNVVAKTVVGLPA